MINLKETIEMTSQFHITVGGTPFCEWAGCMAHNDIAKAAAVDRCTHRTVLDTELSVRALILHGVQNVAIVFAPCPETAGAMPRRRPADHCHRGLVHKRS